RNLPAAAAAETDRARVTATQQQCADEIAFFEDEIADKRTAFQIEVALDAGTLNPHPLLVYRRRVVAAEREETHHTGAYFALALRFGGNVQADLRGSSIPRRGDEFPLRVVEWREITERAAQRTRFRGCCRVGCHGRSYRTRRKGVSSRARPV